MGHKKKGQAPSRSLHSQAYDVLNGMLRKGQGRSKRADKDAGVISDYIYSFSTFKSYMRHVDYFVDWIKINHPDVTTLKKARQYVKTWLEEREASGKYSAYTLQLETAALAKLYGISPDDADRYTPPTRHRRDIVRSRERTETDRHFSESKNELLVRFCRGTGLRRAGLTSIKSDCLYSAEELDSMIPDLKKKAALTERERALIDCYGKISVFKGIPNYYILVKEKGGKWRLAPVLSQYETEVVEKIKSTPPGVRVWLNVPKACDVHGYRGEYAAALYKTYARDIDDIRDKKDIYSCRGDLRGLRLDKAAMIAVEKALGHESMHTFASHYAQKI